MKHYWQICWRRPVASNVPFKTDCQKCNYVLATRISSNIEQFTAVKWRVQGYDNIIKVHDLFNRIIFIWVSFQFKWTKRLCFYATQCWKCKRSAKFALFSCLLKSRLSPPHPPSCFRAFTHDLIHPPPQKCCLPGFKSKARNDVELGLLNNSWILIEWDHYL